MIAREAVTVRLTRVFSNYGMDFAWTFLVPWRRLERVLNAIVHQPLEWITDILGMSNRVGWFFRPIAIYDHIQLTEWHRWQTMDKHQLKAKSNLRNAEYLPLPRNVSQWIVNWAQSPVQTPNTDWHRQWIMASSHHRLCHFTEKRCQT